MTPTLTTASTCLSYLLLVRYRQRPTTTAIRAQSAGLEKTCHLSYNQMSVGMCVRKRERKRGREIENWTGGSKWINGCQGVDLSI